MAKNTYALKVNIRAQEEREKREKERQLKEAISKIQINTSGPPRKKRDFNFRDPGYYIEKGENLRKKAKLEALQKKVAATAQKAGIVDAVKLAALTTNKSVDNNIKPSENDLINDLEEIPEIEWWDRILLDDQPIQAVIKLQQELATPEDIFTGINNLVERPTTKKPPGSNLSSAQIPIYLTTKERKKLRRQNRRDAELEKQEKIKLGLLPKPEPRLKRSNIMYALGDEGIVNPSRIDQLARDQEEKRLQAHIEHNQSKKLTLEEKRAKKLRKVQEDLSVTGIWVSVYRIFNLNSRAHKFKVTKNAKQLTMTGVLALFKDINLVVVEGGPKQQRKYNHLMLDRIRWEEEDPIAAPTDASVKADSSDQCNGATNRCLLVWSGQVSKRSFGGFKEKQMSSESDARAFFAQHNVEQYWDLAFKMSILESIDEDYRTNTT